jgi:glycosyltransferase involved in cell wall biosynthesis
MKQDASLPLRVLAAAATPSVVGGAEAWLEQLLAGLTASGWPVALLYERDPHPARDAVVPSVVPMFSAHTDWAEALAWRPDVVLVNGLADPDLEATLLARFPAMLYAHSYYGTCATGTKLHRFPRPQPCSRTLGVACLALHYPRGCGGRNPVTALADYRRQIARRRLQTHYRVIGVASEHMAHEFQRHGVSPDQIRLLPPPPWRASVSAAQPAVPPHDGPLAFVGRVTYLKGADLLIPSLLRARAMLQRPIGLTILGDGPALPTLVREANRKGILCATPGWLDPEARNNLLRQHAALLMPSLWPEPWGLAGLEAGCLGVPTIATAVGGIPEWVTPGVNGELAATPTTPRTFADAMVRGIQDPVAHRRLSHGAWQRGSSFVLSSHVQAMMRVLHEVVAS